MKTAILLLFLAVPASSEVVRQMQSGAASVNGQAITPTSVVATGDVSARNLAATYGVSAATAVITYVQASSITTTGGMTAYGTVAHRGAATFLSTSTYDAAMRLGFPYAHSTTADPFRDYALFGSSTSIMLSILPRYAADQMAMICLGPLQALGSYPCGLAVGNVLTNSGNGNNFVVGTSNDINSPTPERFRINSVGTTIHKGSTTVSGTLTFGTETPDTGTQLYYCAGGTFAGNIGRGAGMICTGGTATALPMWVP